MIRTNVPHRKIRRVHGLGRDLEREEATVRALAPLQIRVRGDESARKHVCGGGEDACAERGA